MTFRIIAIALISLLITSCVSTKIPNFKLEDGIYAEIETNRGVMLLNLEYEKAPLTVANFVGLAEGDLTVFDTIEFDQPYYDGLIFHRVIDNFMIQTGDPKANGTGGPGYRFYDETDNGLTHHDAGVLSMANAGPNTNGSQFFITHRSTAHLNGIHTVFGHIVVGQDIVDQTQKGDTIVEMKIIRVGKEARKFDATKTFKVEYEKRKYLFEEEQKRKAELQKQNMARIQKCKSMNIDEYKEYFKTLVLEKDSTAVQTASGLMYAVLDEGTGKSPERGDRLQVHYIGTHFYGDKFDSSYDRNQPIAVNYLVQRMIPGFDEALALSKEGSKLVVYIPYYLAYGAQGRPGIGPYADLIFSVSLVDIQ
ncbi:peptidylprolyl isomerase [Lishizhenia sp.]|uniref:peptidylprolyl isomerase n=1 Tax=Lishizhenia sp. TaxID=2497594 RepID=UPI00299EF081|nr:peptidylprolyl isomerase [Lishizhenia sp.]MDX1445249.1 peptidylprolyl isomerase [Lishizhenia sp.]